jgi:hypothetical protein
LEAEVFTRENVEVARNLGEIQIQLISHLAKVDNLDPCARAIGHRKLHPTQKGLKRKPSLTALRSATEV